jgi:hypothetical protein
MRPANTIRHPRKSPKSSGMVRLSLIVSLLVALLPALSAASQGTLVEGQIGGAALRHRPPVRALERPSGAAGPRLPGRESALGRRPVYRPRRHRQTAVRGMDGREDQLPAQRHHHRRRHRGPGCAPPTHRRHLWAPAARAPGRRLDGRGHRHPSGGAGAAASTTARWPSAPLSRSASRAAPRE